ncbi:MAG TPA: hypothetical protein VHL08_01590 [Dongiaceae bacterium]|jgi:hypothetical protein|nr:hypothetical protein [Dongiaceae bacterium]
MAYAIGVPLRNHRYRAHSALAGLGAVARKPVDMPAPQAVWAMVGIAVARDLPAAVEADEIFDAALEMATFPHGRAYAADAS